MELAVIQAFMSSNHVCVGSYLPSFHSWVRIPSPALASPTLPETEASSSGILTLELASVVFDDETVVARYPGAPQTWTCGLAVTRIVAWRSYAPATYSGCVKT